MDDEFALLRPRLVIPVGKLAIAQFLAFEKLHEVIGRTFQLRRDGRDFDLIPLPHPSGASPWHRIEPGKSMLGTAMNLIASHPAMRQTGRSLRTVTTRSPISR
jgi:uracil-DNA glycosylase